MNNVVIELANAIRNLDENDQCELLNTLCTDRITPRERHAAAERIRRNKHLDPRSRMLCSLIGHCNR